MNTATLIGLVTLAFVLGFRHGIDWDHIAAITDLVGGEKNKRRGFILALWYAIGHETVLIVFGGIAVMIGWTLPRWVDGLMARFVGITLLMLAVFLIVSLIRNRHSPMMISRWRLLLFGFYNLFAFVTARFSNRYRQAHDKMHTQHHVAMTRRGAFSIGIVHGIGAETPTQLMMFATASGMGSPSQGMLVVLLFVIGLLISHLLLTVFSLIGFVSALRHRRVIQSVGVIAAVYSLGVGFIFTFGYSGVLPAIL